MNSGKRPLPMQFFTHLLTRSQKLSNIEYQIGWVTTSNGWVVGFPLHCITPWGKDPLHPGHALPSYRLIWLVTSNFGFLSTTYRALYALYALYGNCRPIKWKMWSKVVICDYILYWTLSVGHRVTPHGRPATPKIYRLKTTLYESEKEIKTKE